MGKASVTDAVIIAVIFAGLLYDLFAYVKWGNEATLSVRIFRLAKDWPMLPFLFGVLVGHWFWPLGGTDGLGEPK